VSLGVRGFIAAFLLLSWCCSLFLTVCEGSPECYGIEALDPNGQSLEEKRVLPWQQKTINLITRETTSKLRELNTQDQD